MWHVDEGELHAHLDGELAFVAGERSGEIEAHLAACAECRGRLAEARRVREGAAAILAEAAPPPAAAPPFEELLRRAGKTAGAAPRRRPLPPGAARAASIALALGIGWYAREALTTPRAGERVEALAVERVQVQVQEPLASGKQAGQDAGAIVAAAGATAPGERAPAAPAGHPAAAAAQAGPTTSGAARAPESVLASSARPDEATGAARPGTGPAAPPAVAASELRLPPATRGTPSKPWPAAAEARPLPGEPARSADRALAPRPVRGSVVSEESGLPLAGLTVHLLDDRGQVSATATTDDRGAFVLGELVPGDYRIRIDRGGATVATLPLVIGERVDVPVVLRIRP